MRTASDWFAEYDRFHRNSINKLIHMFAVPVIMLSVLGLLWQVKLPTAGTLPAGLCTLATPLIVGAFIFYLTMRSWRVLALMSAATGACVGLLMWVESFEFASWINWMIWGTGFTLCWIGQFVGHLSFEGKKPSFTDDLLFLLVGPPWAFAEIFGIRLVDRDRSL
jgi:uncharacterized membrane protein YGL010W